MGDSGAAVGEPDTNENIVLPMDMVREILNGAKSWEGARLHLDAMDERQKAMQSDIHQIRVAIAGDAQAQGLRDRVAALENTVGAYKRLLWIVIGVVAVTAAGSGIRLIAAEIATHPSPAGRAE